MVRCRGDLAPPKRALLVLASLQLLAACLAGPLGPLPNVTSAEIGLKTGSCSQGDAVYMPGDQFPGSGPCEQCSCGTDGVQCETQQCEPRPGCKALHRPDHCCPTYQCECEQEGRVYGNGEKLVDPADPCRVCYCQGGEVVCRRIACFVRDDCTPRLVPGRCCPEYDNCPLRGVTALPGLSSPVPSVSTIEIVGNPAPPKENIKQEITIKEITPVSEIPVITEVKIKEILPSPSEAAEYSSSKSPLIPREATSERNINEQDERTEAPTVIEVHSASPVIISSPEAADLADIQRKNTDATPSKISFSTQDSINSDIYPSNVPNFATMGNRPVTAESLPVLTKKVPIVYEEDTFDHNPAFPPLPDDFSVLRNHEDEIVPEPVLDNEHVPSHEAVTASVSTSTEAAIKELTTTPRKVSDTTTVQAVTTEKLMTTTEITTINKLEEIASTQSPVFIKESPMLNLRSAIPTDILNAPSLGPEDINGELDETTIIINDITSTTSTTQLPPKEEETTTSKVDLLEEEKLSSESAVQITTTGPEIAKLTTIELVPTLQGQEQTPSSISKSNIATEVTSQTKLSSLPIKTSDQNPPKVSTNEEVNSSTSIDTLIISSKIPPTSSEIITVGKAISGETTGFENIETTEFFLTSFGSSETATDGVELIKISAEPEKSAAIVDQTNSKNNHALTDLIKLVKDVASISDHTEEPEIVAHVTSSSTNISESEELIPVNAGYKSKNKNFNQNSITEIPIKSKQSANKQKVVEIEDDESESVTDSLPPNDKVEPTTRRPIIDNVSAGNMPQNKTDKKDIEIITQSYVPTINRRPTKVIMQNDEKLTSEERSTDDSPISASVESITESSASSETAHTTDGDVSSVEIDSGSSVEIANATLSSTQ